MGVAGFVAAGLPTGRRPGDWAARPSANIKQSEATNNVLKYFMKLLSFGKEIPRLIVLMVFDVAVRAQTRLRALPC
jgi:hypothetical protein